MMNNTFGWKGAEAGPPELGGPWGHCPPPRFLPCPPCTMFFKQIENHRLTLYCNSYGKWRLTTWLEASPLHCSVNRGNSDTFDDKSHSCCLGFKTMYAEQIADTGALISVHAAAPFPQWNVLKVNVLFCVFSSIFSLFSLSNPKLSSWPNENAYGIHMTRDYYFTLIYLLIYFKYWKPIVIGGAYFISQDSN